jgi:HSP20 family protein
MTLTRWDAFRDLEELSDRLQRAFGPRQIARPQNGGRESMTVADWVPSVDVAEDDEHYLIKVEIPEVKREDVKVDVEDGVLSIHGERRQEKEEKGRKYHRIERSYGSFMRSFTLPENVDSTRIAAEFQDGMLHVSLPKTEKAKPKAIEIKVK